MPLFYIKTFFKTQIVTLSTLPSVIRCYVSILFSKFMSFYTMCFASIYSTKTIAHKKMLFVSKSFKVFRINTSSIFAFVMNMKSFRNLSNKISVRKSMGRIHNSACDKFSIPSLNIYSFIPNPTTAFNTIKSFIKYYISFKSWSTHNASFLVKSVIRHYNTMTTYLCIPSDYHPTFLIINC